MPKPNSRRKGHDFERWVANRLKQWGFTAQRSLQSRGGHGQPDVDVEEAPLGDVHIECKRYKRSAVYKYVHQAERDSGHRPWWWVVLKADHEEPLCIMPLDMALDWAEQLKDCPSQAGEDN
jgi:hypothetical protein